MEETSLHLGALRRQHDDIEARSKAFLTKQRYVEVIDAWLQILLDCHTFALDCHRVTPIPYMEAYAALSSVAFCHAESAWLLLLRGFYGSAFANTRVLFSANDVVADLTTNPESVSKWLQLRSIAPGDRSKQANLLREYFKDSVVRRRITARGEKSASESIYGIASEAVHSSPWATHLFSSEDLERPGEFFIQYDPQYHPFRALLLALMFEASLPNLSGYFLEACVPLPETKGSRLNVLNARYLRRLELYERASPRRIALLKGYKAKEDRVRAGEDFDSVFGDDSNRDPKA